MKCKTCKWYGIENVEVSRIVYEPLIDNYNTITYNDHVKVCNYTNPSTMLHNRVEGCANYECN